MPFYSFSVQCLMELTTQLRIWSYLVKREHVTRNIPLREPRSSICKEISPLSLEQLERSRISKPWVPFRHHLHHHVGLQPATPLSQRPWVMSPMVLDGLDREPTIGPFGYCVD